MGRAAEGHREPVAAQRGSGVQEQDRTTAAPARPLDAGTLRTVYLDLLGRPPLEAEREAWIGGGFYDLLDALLGSREFWQAWFEEQLYFLLLIDNFRPAGERQQAIPAELSEGRLDVRESIHRLALCSSFDQRNPGADTFVTVVMEQLCGITVQQRARELETGKRIYDGDEGRFLGHFGSSQADIVRIACESRDATRTLAAREYERYLHAELDSKELGRWARELHKDPRQFVPLLREALGSELYAARLDAPVKLPNRLYVKTLFVDLVDRLPSREEAEPLREALDGLSDSAPLRSILARLLLDSGRVELPSLAALPDRSAWITGLFRQLLGREPTPLELTTFLEVTADPACRTETVVYAIVSHPDYHRY